jgi:hypothetical protein
MSVSVRFLDTGYNHLFTWAMHNAPTKGDLIEIPLAKESMTRGYYKVARVIWTDADACSVVCK